MPTARIDPRQVHAILRRHGPQPGEILGGRWRLEARVGEGRSGEVFRAHDLRTGQAVALKLLHPDPQRAWHQDLERRGDLLRRLDHPALVRVLEAGAVEERPFLAAELLEGRTLGETLARSGPLPAAEAAAALRPILDALDHLHRRGIVHRDVAPQNVMLTPEGPKLLDYGLARRTGIPEILDPGVIEGTAGYLAPEQVRGEPADGRADLYAVSAVLYEALAGCPPFQGASPEETARARLRRRARIPWSARGTERRLLRVCLRGLARDPGARFASGAEMARAVDEALRGTGSARIARRALAAVARLRRRADLPQAALPWLVIALLVSGALAVWARRTRDLPHSVEVDRGVAILRNVWRHPVGRVALEPGVVAAALLGTGPNSVLALGRMPSAPGADGTVIAVRLGEHGTRARQLWSVPMLGPEPSGMSGLPAALAPLDLGSGRRALLVVWTSGGRARTALTLVDGEGRTVGRFCCPAGPISTWALERAGRRPARLWIAGRSRGQEGRPYVIRLTLPALRPDGWARLAPDQTVAELEPGWARALVTTVSGERISLTGRDFSAIDLAALERAVP